MTLDSTLKCVALLIRIHQLHITPEEQEFGNQYVVRLNELAQR